MNQRFYKETTWVMDPKTDPSIKDFIQNLHDSIFNTSIDFSKLNGFNSLSDEKIQESSRLGNARILKIETGGILYHFGLFFYNRDNGNCFAIYSFNEGKNLIQLVLDNYIEKTPNGYRIWHDGKITATPGLTSEKFLGFVKKDMPDLIKEVDNYEFVELGFFTGKSDIEISTNELNNFIKRFVEYSILRSKAKNDIKKLGPESSISENNESDPIVELIEKYKQHVRTYHLEDEIYKWTLLGKYQGRPDVNALSLFDELRSIEFKNLIYPIGYGVVLDLAKNKPTQYKKCFEYLYDERKQLVDRVQYFDRETLKIYRTIVPDKTLQHHHDERTISTFLTYHNPDKYAFFKDSFYRKYCNLIDVKPKKKGEKYIHYLELLSDFIGDFIAPDKELLSLVFRYIPNDAFQDENHLLLAQDILYQSLDKQLNRKPNYWRIGSSGEDKNYWDEMKSENMICIGWTEIGNLDNTKIESKQDIVNLLAKEEFYPKNKSLLSRKAGEIFNFFDSAKIGDVVIAQDGLQVLGIGIITDDYFFNNESGHAHQRPINWKILNPELTNSEGSNTTFVRITDETLLDKINQFLMTENTINRREETNSLLPLNQILFGPPGTGKTYNSINKALTIINRTKFDELNWNSRKTIKELFDAEIASGRIIFTTFHQSMSYEDFIEGIKPLEPLDDGKVRYKIIDGIFKKACAIAGYYCYKLFKSSDKQLSAYTFDDLYNSFIQDIENKLEKKQHPIFETIRGREVIVRRINSNNSIIASAKDSVAKDPAPLTKENIQKLYDEFKSIDEIKDLSQVQETVQVIPRITEFYAVFKGLKEFEKSFKPDADMIIESKEVESIDYEEIQKQFNEGVYKNAIKKIGRNAPPVVLIIDEINRGNVSQIFGELITLIEDDKRLGNQEAIEATLTYSKQKFGVPPNLFLIGTMNTADRSVEALDAALRRRFNFEEIGPSYVLSELEYEFAGISVAKILKTINKRIEKLLDGDHAIGHSYFILRAFETPLQRLQTAFYKNIIPLLQEYFFGDYGKIGLVLGRGFISKNSWDKKSDSFAEFNSISFSDFEDREVYSIINYTNPDFSYSIKVRIENEEVLVKMNFEKAIKLLMKEAID